MFEDHTLGDVDRMLGHFESMNEPLETVSRICEEVSNSISSEAEFIFGSTYKEEDKLKDKIRVFMIGCANIVD